MILKDPDQILWHYVPQMVFATSEVYFAKNPYLYLFWNEFGVVLPMQAMKGWIYGELIVISVIFM